MNPLSFYEILGISVFLILVFYIFVMPIYRGSKRPIRKTETQSKSTFFNADSEIEPHLSSGENHRMSSNKNRTSNKRTYDVQNNDIPLTHTYMESSMNSHTTSGKSSCSSSESSYTSNSDYGGSSSSDSGSSGGCD